MRFPPLLAAAVVLLPAAHAAPAAAAGPDPLLGAIQRAEAAAQIQPAHALAFRDALARARSARDALRGVRRREMAAAIAIAAAIARRGALTPPRMPVVFLTLLRNAQWWSANGPPTAGSPGENGARGRRCRPLTALRARAARVEFAGSELVFQYYPRLGLQLQVNGTWARANALLASANPAFFARGVALLNELLGIAVARDGVLAWEYEFPIFGARPPWISALSQATAVQALTRAAARLTRPDLLQTAVGAAAAFALPPPAGVRVPVGRSGLSWFALYPFAPRLRVLNAHLQAVSALFDLAQATANPIVQAEYGAGLAAVSRRIAGYDTGRWSRYANPGALADLNYHVLNRDLAGAVCRKSGDAAVCGAAGSFSRELERRCPRPAAPAEAARRG